MNYLLAVTPSSPLVPDFAQYSEIAQYMDEQAAARTLRQMVADAGRVFGRGERSIAVQNRALEARRAAVARRELISTGVMTQFDGGGFILTGTRGPAGDDYHRWPGERDSLRAGERGTGGEAGGFCGISVWA